ncbi:MAG: hypothetical protein NZ601_02480 [candidate division WOR-3 bacterium]|nr:hypothetical protein [candidate division WOR-3 bacterium]MCX7757554.1 hypothetical protein [candidate division WOR-3 bacterium]MDW7987108.1 hypothetical protein [candidate division WOR-3 bacterium]
MSVHIVFYSKSGRTKLVAKTIQTFLNATLEELIDHKKRSGIWGFLTAIFDARFKKLTVISQVQYNPGNFELVVIGTPIWAGMPAPAVRTYLIQYASQIDKIAFFCTHGSSSPENVFKELERIAGKVPIATLAISSKDFKTNKLLEKVKNFVEALK